MTDQHRLGDLQLTIMARLWHRTEATVAEVHGDLQPTHGLALTTIATMLRKMEDKGVVMHRVDGRQFVYTATVSERDVHRSMVGSLVDRLFGGDSRALISHLVEEGEVDPTELEALRREIGDGSGDAP